MRNRPLAMADPRRIGTIPAAILCLGLIPLPARATTCHEAPMLAELAKAGKLPPVEQRLPEHPDVVEPIKAIGKYGGTWRRMAITSLDILMGMRLGYEPLVRWDRSAMNVIPGVAQSWEVLDGGRTYIFHLRKGHKWSDGEPFTSEDILFWFEDVFTNRELSAPTTDELWKALKVTAPDPLTVEFRFAQPNGIFLETVAFSGYDMMLPKHYLKQFHPRYTDPVQLSARAKAETGNGLYFLYFRKLLNPNENPDLPVLAAWKLITPPQSALAICERNPYYYKVDPAGNQLPYIDRITYRMVQSEKMVSLKAMTGEVDYLDRHVSADYAVLQKESIRSQEKSDPKQRFHVIHDPHATTTAVYLNQYSKDPEMRALLQDRRFRIALSVAINRPAVVELIYDGMAQPSRGVSGPFDPFYLPEFNSKYIEYDPSLANSLLDEVGLKRSGSGMRRWPDGREFKPILDVFPTETGSEAELWQLIIGYWREVGLDFAMRTDAASLSVLKVTNGDADFWAYTTNGMWWILSPSWYIPWTISSYHCPLYGLYVYTGGKRGVKPRPEFQRLVDEYRELRGLLPGNPRRMELGQAILRQYSDECYAIGIVRDEQLAVVSNRFHNLPEHIIGDWMIQSPGYLNPEQFYLGED